MFVKRYKEIYEGDDNWKDLSIPDGNIYKWDKSSTYIQPLSIFNDFKNELQKDINIGGIVNIEYSRYGKLDVIPVNVSKDATIGISVSNLVVSIDTFNFISSFV